MRLFKRSSDSIRQTDALSAWPSWPDFDVILAQAAAQYVHLPTSELASENCRDNASSGEGVSSFGGSGGAGQ